MLYHSVGKVLLLLILNLPMSVSMTDGSPDVCSALLELLKVKALGTTLFILEEEQATFGGAEGKAG